MLAEDNLANQELVRQALSKRGHAVTTATNGRDAVRLAGGTAFDIILMDIQMPEMDGLEALRTLRADPDFLHRRTPVIALTAHAFEADRERFLGDGFDGYLSKPFTIPELTRVVEETASRSPQTVAAPAAAALPSLDAPVGPPVDREEALARLDNDQHILETILQLYLQETPMLVASLKEAIETKAVKDVERTAHSIKSVSANIGARHAALLAAGIEKLARDGSLTSVPVRFEVLTREVGNVVLFIRTGKEGKP